MLEARFETRFEMMTRKWWVLLVRGLLGVAIGVFAFARPGLTVLSTVLAWAIFTEADAIAALVLALTGHPPTRSRRALTIAGSVGVAAGLATLVSPSIVVVLLLWGMAAWAIGRGVFQIIAALELRRVVEGEWLIVVSGVLSIVFGSVMIAHPIFGIATLAALIGLYSSAVGLLQIAMSFRVRRIGLTFAHPASPALTSR